MRGLRLLIIFNLFLASAVSFPDIASYEKNKLQQRGAGTLVNKPIISTYGYKGQIDGEGNDSEASTKRLKRERLPAPEIVDGVPHGSGWNFERDGEHKLQRRVGGRMPGERHYDWRTDLNLLGNGGTKTERQLIEEHTKLKSKSPNVPPANVPHEPKFRGEQVSGGGYREAPRGDDTTYPYEVEEHSSDSDAYMDRLRSELRGVHESQKSQREPERIRTWLNDIKLDNYNQRGDIRPPPRAETFQRTTPLRQDPQTYIPSKANPYHTTVYRLPRRRSSSDESPKPYYESKGRHERVQDQILSTRIVHSKRGDFEEGWSKKQQRYISIPRRPDGDGVTWSPTTESWVGYSERAKGYLKLGKQPDGKKWSQEREDWIPAKPAWKPAVPRTRWVFSRRSGKPQQLGWYDGAFKGRGGWIVAEDFQPAGTEWSESKGEFVKLTRRYQKRSIIADVDKQMREEDGQPSSNVNTTALIQHYIDATYELEAVASQRLWPVLKRMVNDSTIPILVRMANGSASPLLERMANGSTIPVLERMVGGSTSPAIYEAAWSIQAQMLGTTDSVTGPFWNGYSIIPDWEDQWLLSRGFWLDAEGAIYMPPGDNHTITNETLRETLHILAFNKAVSDSYHTAWTEGLKAVNGSDNTLSKLMSFKSVLLGLNETLLPESETRVPTGPSKDAAWFEQVRGNNLLI